MLNVGGGIMVSALSSSPGNCLHNSSSLSLEKLLHSASTTGDLNLAGRNLKEFPKHCCKYQLNDTTSAGKTEYHSIYCGDLNTGIVWYSNGQKLSDRRMVRYSNAI